MLTEQILNMAEMTISARTSLGHGHRSLCKPRQVRNRSRRMAGRAGGDPLGRLATSNAAQVTRARQIIEGLGLEVATPDEARQILLLKGAQAVNF